MYIENPSEPSGQSGPTFGANIIHASLTDAKGRLVKPNIVVNVPRGFFREHGFWTCYRRNYFHAHCHFKLEPNPRGMLFLTENQLPLPLGQFYVRLTAECRTEAHISTPVGLIQRAPKGDKLRPTGPGFCALAPSIDEQPLPLRLPREHVFERIQFGTATANNGSRRTAQQFFNIVLELWCEVIGRGSIKIAERVSEPLVVRGRSPRHYSSQDHPYQGQIWRYLHTDDNNLPPQPDGSSFLIQTPILLQQRKFLMPDVDLRRLNPGDPAQTPLTLTGHPNKGHNGLKNAAKTDEPRDDLFWLGKVRNSEQLSIDPVAAEVQDFDISSVSSGSDIFSDHGFVTSVTSSAGPPDLSNVVVSMLLGDEGMKNVCTDGFSWLDPDRFERHLRRSLKAFAKNLTREPSRSLSEDLRYFIGRKVAALARGIREQVQTAQGLEDSRNEIHHVPDAISAEQCSEEKGHGSEVDLSNSDLDYDNDEETLMFTSVGAEAINNNSFEMLREDLLDFVVPFMLNGAMDGQVLQKLHTRYSYKIPGNTLAAAQTSKGDRRATSRAAWSFVSRWFKCYVTKLWLAWSNTHGRESCPVMSEENSHV